MPGSEFAGTIAEVGEGAEHSIGDRVTGTALVGAFAEEIVVESAAVQPMNDGLDPITAAALGVAHRTALHSLRSVARLEPGERLLVLGAGGGVGLAAVQLGAALGAEVVAVASSDAKLAAATEHGAGTVINHRAVEDDLRAVLRERLPDGVAVVLDPVGGDLAEPALRSLRPGGRFVTVGYAAGEIPSIPLNLVLLKDVAVLGFQFASFVGRRPDDFARGEEELAAMVADGRIRPHVGAVFPLADLVDALRLMADGEAVGKVVLDLTA